MATEESRTSGLDRHATVVGSQAGMLSHALWALAIVILTLGVSRGVRR